MFTEMGNKFTSQIYAKLVSLSSLRSTKCLRESEKFEINTKITILHTNDTHSHIHPFTSGRNKGLGGMAQRAGLINSIRRTEDHVLLLDAGDIFQGTPYFNFYGGELEFKLMSEMKYDAATLGNHDFDNGLIGLKKQLPFAKFPFLIANYEIALTHKELGDKFKDYLSNR